MKVCQFLPHLFRKEQQRAKNDVGDNADADGDIKEEDAEKKFLPNTSKQPDAKIAAAAIYVWNWFVNKSVRVLKRKNLILAILYLKVVWMSAENISKDALNQDINAAVCFSNENLDW